VIPVATPEEGLRQAARFPGAVLGGERDGKVIAGYQLGNSPFEYSADRVGGRTLVFASTNGSRALLAAGGRRRVLAAFVNVSAAVDRVRDAREVLIICSGKLGRFSLEDAACAGAIAVRLRALGARPLGAEARLVETLAPRDAEETRAIVQGCSHGRYLRRLGPEFARDVEACAELDTIAEAFEV
jgi:2-phosphosulfolactate phosphatase